VTAASWSPGLPQHGTAARRLLYSSGSPLHPHVCFPLLLDGTRGRAFCHFLASLSMFGMHGTCTQSSCFRAYACCNVCRQIQGPKGLCYG
jgi:hypothetical protein